MSKITNSDVAKVAALARIEFTKEELDEFTIQINSILRFVQTIQSTDTTNIKPTSQVTGLTDVWREDIVNDCELTRDQLLANTPFSQDGYVKVKKVL